MNPNVQVKYKEGAAFHQVADNGAFGAFFRGHDADVRTRQVTKYNEVNAEVRRLETEYGDKNATLVGRINQAGSCGSSAASEAMKRLRDKYVKEIADAGSEGEKWDRANPYAQDMNPTQRGQMFHRAGAEHQSVGSIGGAGGGFRDLEVACETDLSTYKSSGTEKGIQNLIATVRFHEDMGKRRGAVISLQPWFKGDGHSVAVYMGVGTEFWLFDPNLGAYKFS